jgi:hypothetical protein
MTFLGLTALLIAAGAFEEAIRAMLGKFQEQTSGA